MSILSAQSIIRLHQRDSGFVSPFFPTKHIFNGMSYGLSSAGYDVRMYSNAGFVNVQPGEGVLAVTVERIRLPDNILGQVHDKSSWARKFITLQNTILEPGWEGYVTLEITNHSNRAVVIDSGSPIAQIVFHWLDEPTDRPYRGKYQDQPMEPVSSKYEA